MRYKAAITDFDFDLPFLHKKSFSQRMIINFNIPRNKKSEHRCLDDVENSAGTIQVPKWKRNVYCWRSL